MLNSTQIGVDDKKCSLQTTGASERGPIRHCNEDSVAILGPSDHGIAEKGTLLIVADGMGGLQAGEHASLLVTTKLPMLYLACQSNDPTRSLLKAVVEVNQIVYEEGRRLHGEKGIGTTVVAALIVDDLLITVNVGDSRAYCFCNGSLRMLSKDHSMRNEFFHPFASEAKRFSHVLTQAIGPHARVEPFVSMSRLLPGDIVLLCSDGLTSTVSDSEIEVIVRSTDFDLAADTLIARAFANGGDDNVSIALARAI